MGQKANLYLSTNWTFIGVADFILDPTFYFDAKPEQDLAPTQKLGQVNNRPFEWTT